jgi:hypothetical protein
MMNNIHTNYAGSVEEELLRFRPDPAPALVGAVLLAFLLMIGRPTSDVPWVLLVVSCIALFNWLIGRRFVGTTVTPEGVTIIGLRGAKFIPTQEIGEIRPGPKISNRAQLVSLSNRHYILPAVTPEKIESVCSLLRLTK